VGRSQRLLLGGGVGDGGLEKERLARTAAAAEGVRDFRQFVRLLADGDERVRPAAGPLGGLLGDRGRDQ
jgi:hypothetical protein